MILVVAIWEVTTTLSSEPCFKTGTGTPLSALVPIDIEEVKPLLTFADWRWTCDVPAEPFVRA
jgi:hypothetical protein